MQQSRAAIIDGVGQGWAIHEITVADPGPGEITVCLTASGLCHSDDHNNTGDFTAPMPLVGGHEGAGTVVAVGPGATRAREGDHVVLTPNPACGVCRFCSRGRSYLCDLNAYILEPTGPNGRYRFFRDGVGIAAYAQLGTFSEYTTISEFQAVRVEKDLPLESACLFGCAIPTGYGAASKAGQVRAGDAVVVVGAGGVGMNAIQGARIAGARIVVAVDPVEFKRGQAKVFGATHTAQDIDTARQLLSELTRNVMADAVIVCIGVLRGTMYAGLAPLVAKGGRLVITSASPQSEEWLNLPANEFLLSNKSVVGNVWGLANPLDDLPSMFDLARTGQLKMAELVTREYSLDQINQGFADLHAGVNIRGVVRY
jgi:NDMA-dependent alcohol dehydrogenase